MNSYKNLIAGEWVDGMSQTANINPSDVNDVVGHFAQADVAQTHMAIAAAKAAFPAWSRSNPQLRHDILLKASLEVLARKEELGAMLSREEGKTLPEGVGEVTRAAQILGFFAGEALRLTGETLPSVRPNVGVEITREGLGVIGVIAPWNFPIAIPAWKIAPALCYGNTVVFKPAELVPASSWLLVDILHRAGLPSGVLNLVMGKGSVVGQTILNSKDVDGVSFTGSVNTGRKIAESCIISSPMKKMQLEMGGKNPLVVLDDADVKLAVELAVNGSFFSTGQRCTASSRIIVTKGIYKEFANAMMERMKSLVVDHALKAGTHIGPVVDINQLQNNLSYIKIGQDEGAKLALGGEVLKRDTDGFYMSPALFLDATNHMRISREEIFGPVAALIPASDYDEALALANDTEFGLASGICTTSLKYATHFKRNAEAGMVMVNLPTAGVDYHVPFGGRKGSSYGAREQGAYAKEFYTTVKTAYTFA